MSETVIVALLSLIGTFIGSFSGIKLITYRIQQLENKVEKHNRVIERVYKLEQHEEDVDKQLARLESYHS